MLESLCKHLNNVVVYFMIVFCILNLSCVISAGMAMDMEEGWYGAKMTGSSVKVAFPGPRKTTQDYRYTII